MQQHVFLVKTVPTYITLCCCQQDGRALCYCRGHQSELLRLIAYKDEYHQAKRSNSDSGFTVTYVFEAQFVSNYLQIMRCFTPKRIILAVVNWENTIIYISITNQNQSLMHQTE